MPAGRKPKVSKPRKGKSGVEHRRPLGEVNNEQPGLGAGTLVSVEPSTMDPKDPILGKKKTMRNVNKTPKGIMEEHIYHVTHTKNVPSIQKKGLLPMRTSNWVKAGDNSRYGGGEVHAFTHKDDAKAWAGKMDWAHNKTLGSGKISIITSHRPSDREFAQDTNDPLSQAGRKGDWIKTSGSIHPKHIVSVEPYMPKKLGEGEVVPFARKGDLPVLPTTYISDPEHIKAAKSKIWDKNYSDWKARKKAERMKTEATDKLGKQTPSVEEIAKKHNISVDQVNAQLDKGVKVEREHTNSDDEAREIARDHVHEFPDYYDRLDKMETKAKKGIKESYEMEKKLERHRQNQHSVDQVVDHKGLISYRILDHKNKVVSKHDYKSDAYERAAELNRGGRIKAVKEARVMKMKDYIKQMYPKQELPPKTPAPVALKGYERVKDGKFNVLRKIKESLKEAAGDGNPSNNRGVLHELLVGYHLRGGKHMEKHKDVNGDSPKQAHDKVKANITPEEYKGVNHRAKAAAKDIATTLGRHGKIHDVHWTSKPGDIQRSTGIKASQKEDASDIVVHTKKGGQIKHHGVSLKVTDSKTAHVPVSNPGLESTHGGEKILAAHRKAIVKAHPAIGRMTNKEERKKYIRAHPAVQKKIQALHSQVLPKFAKHLSSKLGALPTSQLADHLRKHILKANPTPMQQAGHTHLRHTTHGAGGSASYGFSHSDPSKDHEHILKDHKNISVSASGTSVIFAHKGTPFARHRLKLQSQSDPMSTIKGSGELIKGKKSLKEAHQYDPDKDLLRSRIVSHTKVAEKMAKQYGDKSIEAGFHRALVKRYQKELGEETESLDEDVPNSVGGGMSPVIGGEGNIHGIDPIIGRSSRSRKFAGKQVFVVDPTTYHNAHLGKRRYEHFEKYLEGSPMADEIREYARKYWDESIIIENEQTGAMVYLKYGSK